MSDAARLGLVRSRWSIALGVLAGLWMGACDRPDGMWRDQFVFIADDGTVIPVGVVRWSSGRAEAKAWFGEGGQWGSSFFHRFEISGPAGPDVDRAMALLSAHEGTPARVSLARRDRGIELRLRTRSELFVLDARDLSELGEPVDPEGASVYRAGRATWTGRGRSLDGWLVVEETPRERPRRPFVEFGDFVFLVLADPERGTIVVKRSLGLAAFDHALVGGAGPTRRTDRVELSRGESSLDLSLPELDLRSQLSIRDRQVTHGQGPDGSDVDYETLLLGGDRAGVAFTIHPARETSP
mgnify:CR=1 FL=1